MSTTISLFDKGFYAFPPEVRELIFKEALSGVWDGKTPALIQALRGSRIYLEATTIFAEANTFKMHRGNGWSFGDMPKKAIQTFKKLQIDLDGGEESDSILKALGCSFEEEIGLDGAPEIKVSKLEFPASGLISTVSTLIIRPPIKSILPITFRNPGAMVSSTVEFLKIILTCFLEAHQPYKITELRILTQGCPAPFQTTISNAADWLFLDLTFELYSEWLLTITNILLNQFPVLATVSTNNFQEWFWRCSEGLHIGNSLH